MRITDGTSQKMRRKHLLGDDYFRVMELNFQDLLCFIRDYSRELKYFNLKNEADGSWEQLLLADELMVLADILTYNTNLIEDEFINILENQGNEDDAYFIKLIAPMVKLVEQIDFWYVSIKHTDTEGKETFENELKGLIQNVLSHELQVCKSMMESVLSNKISFKNLDQIWFLREHHTVPQEIYLNNIYNPLKKSFYTFKNSIAFLKQKARFYLDKSLKSQEHSPHMALIITFIKLYLETNSKLNHFTNRYFDFYYEKVLKTKALSYAPDKTYLQFQLKEGISNFLIEKDSLFLGGKDDSKKKIYYKADNDLVVNTARIKQLFTLFCDQNDLIWPQIACNGIVTDEIPILNADSNQSLNTPKALLGKAGLGNAKMGFAISDGCFLLSEGNRKISIEFCFVEHTYRFFEKQLEKLFGKGKLRDEFIKLFYNIFSVYVSVENTWFKIEHYIIDSFLIDKSRKENSLYLECKLSTDDPAICNVNAQIHGKFYKENIPAIKVLLNEEAYLYPYEVLKGLQIERITINTEVEGLKKITVHNELGQVDVAKPFHPFGVIPKLNSYFILGGYEFSKKNLTSLSIKLSWSELPQQHDGFVGYFKAYKSKPKKSDYKCTIGFLNGGAWVPEENHLASKFPLFSSESGESLPNKSLFANIETHLYKQNQEVLNEENYRFDHSSTGGFLKIKLINPPFAFGHAEYPDVLSEISINNARKKVNNPLPNPPFSPLIENIKVDYKAQSVIEFKKLKSSRRNAEKQFYHIYPWGHEEILGTTKFDHIPLIPSFQNKGNLFIGLENAEANWTITFLFHLLDDSKLEVEMDPPALYWEYLASNQWRTLPNTSMVSDTTNGFLNSGIVTILLPQDINKENTIMSNSLHWIKVSANEHLEGICSVVNITAQALQLTWINQGNHLSHLNENLPAYSISKAKGTLSGISGIAQPLPSFQGQTSEDNNKVKLRISERLRHKNRAVTSWDYERIILQHFPELAKVKCIPHATSASLKNPGHLLIVVIGKSINGGMFYNPMLGNKTLHDIKKLVLGVNSAFANIEVRNPVYEQVQVRCAVKIKSGLDSGYFIDLINTRIIEYLSPWKAHSLNEAGFGKIIKCTDVLSFIQNLNFIEWATDFSILHVSCDSQKRYKLFDTADKRKDNLGKDGGSQWNEIKPTYPWAILVPMQQHALKIIYDNKDILADKTGIDELLLENTFIIEE